MNCKNLNEKLMDVGLKWYSAISREIRVKATRFINIFNDLPRLKNIMKAKLKTKHWIISSEIGARIPELRK